MAGLEWSRRSVEDGHQSRIVESEATAVARCTSRSLGETRAGVRFLESCPRRRQRKSLGRAWYREWRCSAGRLPPQHHQVLCEMLRELQMLRIIVEELLNLQRKCSMRKGRGKGS